MNQVELIQVRAEGSEKTITFSSNHLNDTDTAHQIAHHVRELIGRTPSNSEHEHCLNLDFGNIDRISSAGLNELIGLNSQARNCGVRLVLLDVQDALRDVFAVTRLERMFEFGSSVIST